MRLGLATLAVLAALAAPGSLPARQDTSGSRRAVVRPKPPKPLKRPKPVRPMVRRDRRGRIVQTSNIRSKKNQPCPTTGKVGGPCPGFAAQPAVVPRHTPAASRPQPEPKSSEPPAATPKERTD